MRATRAAWLVTLVVAACADRGPKFRAAGNATPRDGGTLRYSTVYPVRTLDPTIQYDEISHSVVHALFDTLVDYDRGGLRLIPRLARSWTVSPDGLIYTFALRDGVTYSDGTPIVAEDFIYSFERAKTTPDSPFGQFLAEVKATRAPTERELVVELARPNAAFIYVLAMPFTTPQKRAHVEAAGDQLRRRPLGSGPYVLERWDEGERLVLRRNPRYWDPSRSHIEVLEHLENVPRDTQFMMFERGELDTAERLSLPDQLWVASHAAWQPYIHRTTAMNTFGSRMNVRVKPFDDRRVRQALNYALDKRHSVKLLGGGAVPAHGLLFPGMLGRDDTLRPYPHDPAKARALLAEAGYPNGLDLEYVVQADEEAERLALSLQADLGAVGVRVRLTRMAWAAYASTVGSASGAPFAKIGWVGDFPDPTSFLDPQFHSRSIDDDASTNYSFYANPELDALLDAARVEPDVVKREALYRRAERILYDDAPWLWDYHQQVTEIVQPYVAGYAPHPVWLRDYTSAWLDVGPDGPVPR